MPDNGFNALIHQVGIPSLSENGLCSFNFVLQTEKDFIKATCTDYTKHKFLKDAQNSRSVVHFNQVISKIVYVNRLSEVCLANDIQIEWLNSPVRPDVRMVTMLEIFTGKVAADEIVEVKGFFRQLLQSEFNADKEIAQYLFEDCEGVEMKVKRWSPQDVPELDQNYKLLGKVNCFSNQVYLVVMFYFLPV